MRLDLVLKIGTQSLELVANTIKRVYVIIKNIK